MRILILIAFIFTLSIINAQNYYKSQSITILQGDSEITRQTEVIISLNIEEERIIIYSAEAQIIDYKVYEIEKDNDGSIDVYCNATDSYYKNVKLWMRFKDDYAMFAIIYSDMSYAYYTKYIQDPRQ